MVTWGINEVTNEVSFAIYYTTGCHMISLWSSEVMTAPSSGYTVTNPSGQWNTTKVGISE